LSSSQASRWSEGGNDRIVGLWRRPGHESGTKFRRAGYSCERIRPMSLLKWALIMWSRRSLASLVWPPPARMWPASCSISSLSSSWSCSSWAWWGESRARTLTSNARCQVRQRAAAAKREPRSSVAFEKRGCSSGVSGILRGAGGTRTPSGETPYARQIFRTRGAAMPDLFPVPLRFVRRAGFSLEAFTATCAEFLERPRRAYRDRARPPWQVR
jgi:hypothetical protein